MKNLLLGMLLLGSAMTQAQTFNEWFRQKKTQIRYYVEQIAALKVYGKLVNDGYAVARDGLTLISDLKQGAFDLHNDYFHSLRSVNSSIAHHQKVTSFNTVYQQLVRQIEITRSTIQQNGGLNHQEKEYMHLVLNRLQQLCDDQREDYVLLTSDNHYALTDEQRLQRIMTVIEELKNQYAFIKSFHHQLRVLLVSRKKEGDDIRAQERLYMQTP